MAILHVERIGGLANFGGAGAHVKSRGHLDTTTLSPEEQNAVEGLFQSQKKAEASAARDMFRYRISRTTSAGTQTIEVPESVIPTALAQCVKDELV
jgi:hypothetical protein